MGRDELSFLPIDGPLLVPFSGAGSWQSALALAAQAQP